MAILLDIKHAFCYQKILCFLLDQNLQDSTDNFQKKDVILTFVIFKVGFEQQHLMKYFNLYSITP